MNQQELKRLQWKLRMEAVNLSNKTPQTLDDHFAQGALQDKIDAISAKLRGEPIPGHAQKAAKELGL